MFSIKKIKIFSAFLVSFFGLILLALPIDAQSPPDPITTIRIVKHAFDYNTGEYPVGDFGFEINGDVIENINITPVQGWGSGFIELDSEGVYTISETVFPEGTDILDWNINGSCFNSLGFWSSDGNGVIANVNVAIDEETFCQFENERLPDTTLKIVKNAQSYNPISLEEFAFDFQGFDASSNPLSVDSISIAPNQDNPGNYYSGEQVINLNDKEGIYTITEVAPSTTNWKLDYVNCYYDSDPATNVAENNTDLENFSVSNIEVLPQQQTVCEFSNSKQPTEIKIIKEAENYDPESGNPEEFVFSVSGADGSPLNDSITPDEPLGNGFYRGEVIIPLGEIETETYTITELLLQNNPKWYLESVVCTAQDGSEIVNLTSDENRNLLIPELIIAANEQTTCTFVNKQDLADVSIIKNAHYNNTEYVFLETGETFNFEIRDSGTGDFVDSFPVNFVQNDFNEPSTGNFYGSQFLNFELPAGFYDIEDIMPNESWDNTVINCHYADPSGLISEGVFLYPAPEDNTLRNFEIKAGFDNRCYFDNEVTSSNGNSSSYNLDVNALDISLSGSLSVDIFSLDGYGGVTNTADYPTVVTNNFITLTAPLDSGNYRFQSWSGCDSVDTVNGNTCNLTMNSDKTVTANYIILESSLEIRKYAYDYEIGDGAFDFDIIRELDNNVDSISVTPDTPFMFLNGQEGYTNYTAGNPPAISVEPGLYTLTETSLPENWSPSIYCYSLITGLQRGNFSAANTTNNIQVDNGDTVVCDVGNTKAEIPPEIYNLNVSVSGIPVINIASLNGNYGGVADPNYSRSVEEGSVAILEAPFQNNAGTHSFISWTGCDGPQTSSNVCNVTMDSPNKSVTANYSSAPPPESYTLTVTSSGANNVDILSSSAHAGNTGINGYTYELIEGAFITLSAPATASGLDFSSWSGCDSVFDGGISCAITLNEDKTVTAVYVSPPPAGSTNLRIVSYASYGGQEDYDLDNDDFETFRYEATNISTGQVFDISLTPDIEQNIAGYFNIYNRSGDIADIPAGRYNVRQFFEGDSSAWVSIITCYTPLASTPAALYNHSVPIVENLDVQLAQGNEITTCFFDNFTEYDPGEGDGGGSGGGEGGDEEGGNGEESYSPPSFIQLEAPDISSFLEVN